jgi:hypothetical protein
VTSKISPENRNPAYPGTSKIIETITKDESNPMKTFIRTFGFAAMLALALFAGQVRAQDQQNDSDATAPPSNDSNAVPNDSASALQNGGDSVSFQTFYDQLAGQGTWIQADKYGYVFQPTESDPNWRPYTYGHWVNTDAGLTWVSDDSFGWATDHYGRWVNLDGYGWVWVPGYTWAPAWVSWREGDDEVGWAPLPPDSDQGIDFYDDDDYFTGFDFGFHIGDDCDLAYGIGPWCYNFCPIAYIGDRDCWRHFRDHRDNFAFIGHTRNVTNINFRRDGTGRFGQVHAEGPSVAALNARARTPIAHAQLTSASRLGNAGLHGNTLAVYAPRVDPATVKTTRPASVGERLTNTTVNRGTDINRPLAVNSRVRPAGPTAEQIHAAALAQGNVPAGAKIATANTRISRPLTQPLTSMRTNTRSSAAFGPSGRLNAVNGTTHVATPSFSNESRFTGAPIAERPTISSSGESRFTGEPFGSEAFAPSHATSSESYHPSSVFHESAPIYHSSTPSYYHPQSSFHSYTPPQSGFRTFAPPQSSFRSYAPASHFGGGGFGGGAPAAHFSGGGGGGLHGGGGGGAVHASAGGGSGRH